MFGGLDGRFHLIEREKPTKKDRYTNNRENLSN